MFDEPQMVFHVAGLHQLTRCLGKSEVGSRGPSPDRLGNIARQANELSSSLIHGYMLTYANLKAQDAHQSPR